jgi:hypothetical protein
MVKWLQSGLLCLRISGKNLINYYNGINIGNFFGMSALRLREKRCSTRNLGKKLRIFFCISDICLWHRITLEKLDWVLDAGKHLLLPPIKLTKSKLLYVVFSPDVRLLLIFKFCWIFLERETVLVISLATKESKIKIFLFIAINEKIRTEIWAFLRHHAA